MALLKQKVKAIHIEVHISTDAPVLRHRFSRAGFYLVDDFAGTDWQGSGGAPCPACDYPLCPDTPTRCTMTRYGPLFFGDGVMTAYNPTFYTLRPTVAS